jgi:hypothetical protein
MTDEEIDTSDIPSQGDAFFAKARWRLPRLYIYRMDFIEAKAYAAHILHMDYHQKKSDTRKLVHRALNTSVILAYSRPFTQQRDLHNKKETTLEVSVGEVLSEPQAWGLHKKILGLRDMVYAHSDARAREIKGLPYGKSIALFYWIENLTEPETVSLETMIETWIGYLDKKISLLKSL